MGKQISGTFNGTGAAVYICCGFVPDEVELFGVENSVGSRVRWSKDMRAADMIGGLLLHGCAAVTLYTATQGIIPYHGGDLLTSTNQTSVTYGEGVYLGWDYTDYRNAGTLGEVTDWTLDTLANRTGHVNAGVNTTYVGEGSQIQIDGKWYTITAISNDGDATDEITLDRAVSTGKVHGLSGMYMMKPLARNTVTPAGFQVAATTYVNVNNEIQWFTAKQYDN